MIEREISAGAIVFRRQNGRILYLLLYKKAHGRYREAWGFPRGNIEQGENAITTARREIEEETGISDLQFVKGFKEKIHFFYRKEGKLVSKDIIYLLAQTNQKDVKLSFEHDGFAWLPFEQAKNRLTFDSDRNVLVKANAFLKKVKEQKKVKNE